MDYREDYFKSPSTKSLESFYQGNFRFHADEVGIPHQILFSPFQRDCRSPFSAFSPVLQKAQKRESDPAQDDPTCGPKTIKDKVSFDDSYLSEQEQKSPQRAKPQLHMQETAGSKKYHLRPQELSQKNNLGKDSQRGLRALSKQSFEILKQSQALTYQQVAMKIIGENDEIGEYSEKEKQSIKRRVYDALNVLIAVKVLEKVGKKINVIDRNEKQSSKGISYKKQLKSQLQKKMDSIFNKKELERLLRVQNKKIEAFINRNRKLSDIDPQESKIFFPVILIGAGKKFHKQSGEVTVFVNSEGGKKQIGSYKGVEFQAIAHLDIVSPTH